MGFMRLCGMMGTVGWADLPPGNVIWVGGSRWKLFVLQQIWSCLWAGNSHRGLSLLGPGCVIEGFGSGSGLRDRNWFQTGFGASKLVSNWFWGSKTGFGLVKGWKPYKTKGFGE